MLVLFFLTVWQEYQSFTDLKFSKDKVITWIDWHPTIKGIVSHTWLPWLDCSRLHKCIYCSGKRRGVRETSLWDKVLLACCSKFASENMHALHGVNEYTHCSFIPHTSIYSCPPSAPFTHAHKASHPFSSFLGSIMYCSYSACIHPSTHSYIILSINTPLPPACNPPPFHTHIHRYSPTPPPGMHTGTLAVSCGGSYSFDERIELSSRLLHTHSLILIWSFADPIHPQVTTLHTHISYFTRLTHVPGISLYLVYMSVALFTLDL